MRALQQIINERADPIYHSIDWYSGYYRNQEIPIGWDEYEAIQGGERASFNGLEVTVVEKQADRHCDKFNPKGFQLPNLPATHFITVEYRGHAHNATVKQAKSNSSNPIKRSSGGPPI